MDTNTPSSYLAARLRAQKAASSAARDADISADRWRRSGRDDDVLDLLDGNDDDDSPTARRRTKQTSPPTSYRHGPEAGRRPTAGSNNTTNSASSQGTTRGMGVRQMEEQVDKLTKQNFDLKMDIFHLREKVDILEKKAANAETLEVENEELAAVNEMLTAEVEQRDKAVDEAVVMICELEESNRELEDALQVAREELVSTRNTHQEDDTGARRTLTPRKTSPAKEHRRGKVSEDVSARIAGLASPSPQAERKVPSFLTTQEPNTDALRSLFVQNDKAMRRIPSQASLLSRSTTKEEEESMLNSPRLSVLSLSELKSLYGQDQSDEKSPQAKPQFTNEVVAEDGSIEERRARTDRWVTDRAVPSRPTHKSIRPPGRDVSQFQSLGGVLTQEVESGHYQPKSTVGQFHQTQRKKHSETPPLMTAPIFGPQLLPPTPDTMQTRPSNHSTPSIGRDGYYINNTGDETIRASHPPVAPPHGQLVRTSTHSTSSSRNARRSNKRHEEPPKDPSEDFGASLFRLDSGGESTSPEDTRDYRAAPRLFDGRDVESMLPTRRGTTPPSGLGSRRRSVDFFAASPPSVFPSAPKPLAALPRSSTDGTLEALALARTDHQRTSPSKRVIPSSYQPLIRSNTTAATSASRGRKLLSRGASLREKFSRRNSNSTTNSDGLNPMALPSGVPPTDQDIERRNGISQRFARFRRNSNSNRPPTSSTSGDERIATSNPSRGHAHAYRNNSIASGATRSIQSSGGASSLGSASAHNVPAAQSKASLDYGTKAWAEGGMVGAPNMTSVEDRRPGTARPSSKAGVGGSFGEKAALAASAATSASGVQQAQYYSDQGQMHGSGQSRGRSESWTTR